jgi:Rrf2 family protein
MDKVEIMQWTARAEYAFLAVVDLSEHWEAGEIVKIRDIARRKFIPYKYLTQVLVQLKTAGVARSIRGSAGGYVLARHPREISLWDVVQAMASPGTQLNADRGRRRRVEVAGILRTILEEVSDKEKEILDRYSFEELVTMARENAGAMYQI